MATSGEPEPTTSIPVKRSDGQTLGGICKHWNPIKGFGFVTADDGGEDLFVHQSELQTDRFRALIVGAKVEGKFKLRDGKPILTAVTGSSGSTLRQLESKLAATQLILGGARGDAKSGVVKWFRAERGFGFIVPAEGGDDMFIHIKEVQGMVPPQAGDTVEYLVKQDKEGKPVAGNVINKSQALRGPPAGQMPPPQYGSPYGAPPQYGAQPQYGYPPQQQQQQQPAYGAPMQTGPAGYPAPAGDLSVGSIKFFGQDKGWGFIIPKSGAKEVYFRGDACDTPQALQPGVMVTYRERTAAEGKVWAQEVRLASSGGAAAARSTGGKRKYGETGMYDYGQAARPVAAAPAGYGAGFPPQQAGYSNGASRGYAMPSAAPGPIAGSGYGQQPSYGQQQAQPAGYNPYGSQGYQQ